MGGLFRKKPGLQLFQRIGTVHASILRPRYEHPDLEFYLTLGAVYGRFFYQSVGLSGGTGKEAAAFMEAITPALARWNARSLPALSELYRGIEPILPLVGFSPYLLRTRVGGWMLAGMGNPEPPRDLCLALGGPMLQLGIDILAKRVDSATSDADLRERLAMVLDSMLAELAEEESGGCVVFIESKESGPQMLEVAERKTALADVHGTTFVFTAEEDSVRVVIAGAPQPGSHPVTSAEWLRKSRVLLSANQGELIIEEREGDRVRGSFQASGPEGTLECADFEVEVQDSAESITDQDLRVLEATSSGDLARLEQALSEGAPVNARSAKGRTALGYAAYANRPELIDRLLQAGADPNLGDLWGLTPLMVAATEGHSQVVGRLLAAGASPDLQTSRGMTALMLAAMQGHEELVDVLLRAGANPNLQDSGGIAALMPACDRGRISLVRKLLAAGADPNLRDQGQGTALLGAAFSGNLEILEALLQAGARHDLADGEGFTALMSAARAGHPALVARLLEAGAAPQTRDQAGKTALDHATNPEVRRQLAR